MVKNTVISMLLLIIATLAICCVNLNKAANGWKEQCAATEEAYEYLDKVRMEELTDYETQITNLTGQDCATYTDTTLYDNEIIAVHYVQMATWGCSEFDIE